MDALDTDDVMFDVNVCREVGMVERDVTRVSDASYDLR